LTTCLQIMSDDPITAITPVRVLLICRDQTIAGIVSSALAECLSTLPDLVLTTGGRTGVDVLRREPVEVVVAELDALADLDPHPDDAVARLAKSAGAAIVVILSADASVSAALAAMRAGAHDCVAKPVTSAALAERLTSLAMRHGRGFALRSTPAQPDTGRVGPGPAPQASPARGPQGANDVTILPMWRQEQQIIEQAIASFSGNVALAAAALQVSPSTIYRKRQAWAEVAAGRKGAA
jgi:DNA-binding NtrC family response regulator